jgi:hypothetical protein
MGSAPFSRVAAHAPKWQKNRIEPCASPYDQVRGSSTLDRTTTTRRLPRIPSIARRLQVLCHRDGSLGGRRVRRRNRRGGGKEGYPSGVGVKSRVVIDYTAQKEVLGARKFRMDTLADLAPQLRPGNSLIKADVSDAYYHLRLR